MSQSERLKHSLNRILQIIVLIYQGIALIAFMVIPFLAVSWMRAPFLGAFVEQTMVFNGVGQETPTESWGLFLDKQLWINYQIANINGMDVHNEAQIRTALAGTVPGQPVPVVVRRISDGVEDTRTVTLQTFPGNARVVYFFIPYIVGLIFLGISLWIFGLRRTESSGRAFALFATSVALGCAALFDLYTTHRLSLLWTFALACGGGALIDLALVFPQEIHWLKDRPSLRWIGYAAGLILTILAAFHLYDLNQPAAYILNWRYIYLMSGLAILFFVGMVFNHRFSAKSPVVRQQAGAILWGAFGLAPLGAWFLLTALQKSLLPFPQVYNFSPWLLLPMVVFPLVTGYTILGYRLLRTDFLPRQGALYALLMVLALGGYALLVSGLVLIFDQTFKVNNPLFIGMIVFLLALGLNPLRNRLERFVDSVFFRGVRTYEQRLREFSQGLTNTVDLTAIISLLREHINNSLLPDRMHVYVYDPLSEQYVAAAGEDGRPTSDIRFNMASPLVQKLGKAELPICFDEDSLPPELRAEQAHLALQGAQLYVPLPGSGRPIGWLALGERRSGETYTAQDLVFLTQIGNAAAIAVERGQVIFNLERRVREMNILARVAQGVNTTVAFDDILELIYTQTDQVLPVDNFHITLYNKESDYYYFAYCLENKDRLTDRENLPLPAATGLSLSVIHNNCPIVTSDYERECQARNLTPFSSGVHAWVGVPLNAGADTIGALSIGNHDSSVVYTASQQELLQSIAEQTAGAIVKARLLLETERRARQLSTLNDITRQLTGTLQTEPLLQIILDSAVTILNCEAGSFFLVDEATDELVFMVTNGPVAQNLIGQRLPPGSGIVGQAVETQSPVVENDVQHSASRFVAIDQQTGFITRALLAVPLKVKEIVIGVLEVINRKDGLPFVDDDQNLLSAFAGQASVAIENARLYTLTDQELNTRVEELSVMQRIDRELNASLDVTRAMRLTLEWALRQSNADAGLIGILEGKGIHLIAQQGYEEIEQTYIESPMPLEQPAMRLAVETGQLQRMLLDDLQPGLLAGARTQTVVPICREANVIGLITLESRSTDLQADQELTFLTRLSDHASIAISNAQLYHAVQAANDAKSEFVSFVAHELKNPMTSIKGYTELLSKGAVGPVTDMQANFLATIHSNVERMSTLVSDLNDNSKIEANRLRLDFKAVKIAEVVDDVMRSAKRQMEDRKQSVSVNLSAGLPKVWADRTRLAQIVTNLVSNANKYTPEGGIVTVGAEESANQWDPEGAAEVVHIWVQDNGIGIGPEDQNKIFRKFFRSDDSKAREAPGTGLGLNITKSLIEMMGGRIWFESEFRQGTIFHFTVPVAGGYTPV